MSLKRRILKNKKRFFFADAHQNDRGKLLEKGFSTNKKHCVVESEKIQLVYAL